MAVLSGGGLEGENYSRKLGKKITRVLLLFSTQGWGRERGNVVIKKDKYKHKDKQTQIQMQTRTNITRVLFLFSTQGWWICGHPT